MEYFTPCFTNALYYARLTDEHRTVTMQFNTFKINAETQISALDETIAETQQQIHGLQRQLLLQTDYEQVLHERNILKSIEFNNGDKEISGKSLELLLREKTKRLENENIDWKNQLQHAILKFQTMESALAAEVRNLAFPFT